MLKPWLFAKQRRESRLQCQNWFQLCEESISIKCELHLILDRIELVVICTMFIFQVKSIRSQLYLYNNDNCICICMCIIHTIITIVFVNNHNYICIITIILVLLSQLHLYEYHNCHSPCPIFQVKCAPPTQMTI